MTDAVLDDAPSSRKPAPRLSPPLAAGFFCLACGSSLRLLALVDGYCPSCGDALRADLRPDGTMGFESIRKGRRP